MRAAGKREKITITNDKGRLSQEEIERMVQEAEEFAEQDKAVKGKVDARNALETYCYNMKQTIEDKLGDKLDEDDKEKVGSHALCVSQNCAVPAAWAVCWLRHPDPLPGQSLGRPGTGLQSPAGHSFICGSSWIFLALAKALVIAGRMQSRASSVALHTETAPSLQVSLRWLRHLISILWEAADVHGLSRR